MRISVLATGGTIASTGAELSPTLDAATVLEEVMSHGIQADGAEPDGIQPAGAEIRARQVLAIDSAAMGPLDMTLVCDAVAAELVDADAVLVLHGTDTMEETALLTDLRLHPDKPVVFTGAQRGADHPEPDGPANIRGALAPPLLPGVHIFFGGRTLPVWGARKAHTQDLAGFDHTPAGEIRAAALAFLAARPPRTEPPRTDIVALYPGADRTALDALVAVGARGLVLQAMGAGNANAEIVAGVRDAVAAGVVVVVSTRVPHGPAFPGYAGGGGGADLVAAGAVFSPTLRSGQTRIVLGELLAADATAAQVAAVLAPGDRP